MTKPILKLENIKKTYRSKKRYVHALKEVSFSLNKGEVLGVVGGNGAGKTTILRILCGLTSPDSGKVHISNTPWKKSNASKYIGALLEGSRSLYWGLTGRQNLMYFARIMNIVNPEQRIKEISSQLQIDSYIDRLVRTYSRGMQQRTVVAITLLHSPSILLLDEPTTGLDFEAVKDLAKLILELKNNHGVSILLVSHEIDFLQKVSDRIIYLKGGTIAETFQKVDWIENQSLYKNEVEFHFVRMNNSNDNDLLNAVNGSTLTGYLKDPEFLKSILTLCKDGYEIIDIEQQKKERVLG